MIEQLSRFGAKVGSQRHMTVIRDSFAATMPLIMAGALAVLMNNVFFVPWSLLAKFIGAESSFIVWTSTNVAPFFGAIDAGAFAILSLALAFALGYNLTNSYGKDPLSGGLLAVGGFFILGPLTRVSQTAGWVSNYLGAQGLFVALLTGLLAAQIFVLIVQKGWVITMPEMVPPAVGRAFVAIIPGAIVLLTFALINYLFAHVSVLAGATYEVDGVKMVEPNTIFNWVETNISGALQSLLGGGEGANAFIGAGFASLISLFVGLFWSIGLHGANLLAPVMDGIYLGWGTENAQAFANNLEPAHVWVRGSWDAFVFLGGSGTTLALLLAIRLYGKKEEELEVAKLSLPPGLFQINEPAIFGLPIVLNPIYAIPFIISQPILTFIAYMATASGLVPKVVNIVPWTTPPILGAFMATNFSVMAALLALFNLVLAFFIYLPFVIASNKANKN